MSKKTDMEKVESEVPSYLAEAVGDRTGFEEMRPNDLITPAIVCIQKTHPSDVLEKFGPGS